MNPAIVNLFRTPEVDRYSIDTMNYVTADYSACGYRDV